MLRIALKSVLARKRRLLTTGFAIVLSVAFISGTLVITALINTTLDGLIGGSYRNIDAVVRSANAQESRFGQPIRDPIPASTLEKVRATTGVRSAEGFVQGLPTIIDKHGDRIQDTFGPPTLAFNWVDDPLLQGGRLAKGGRPPRTPDEVVMDVRTAREFGFEVGDTVQAQFPAGLRTLTIVGLGGIPVEGSQELKTGPRVLILESKTAAELLKKPDGYDYIAATAKDGTSQRGLATLLRQRMPRGVEVITGGAFIRESEATLSKIISLFTTPILAFGFISVFVGAFVIYNTFSIVVAQRTRELALLRCVGAGRGQILGSVLFEAVLVGLVASTLGILGGWALAGGLKAALAASLSLPAGVPPMTTEAVVVALAVGVGSTTLSALVPGFGATFIPPVAALGEVALDRSALSVARKVVGTILAIAGVGTIALNTQGVVHLGVAATGVGALLTFLALATLGPVFAGPLVRGLGAVLPGIRGVAGRIGKENASRNPKRTAITAVALSVGVSLVVVVSIIASSFRGAIDAQRTDQLAKIDLVVDSGTGFAGLGPDAAGYLRSRPEVETINPIRFNIMTVLDSKKARDDRKSQGATKNGVPVGESQFVIGVDPTAVFEIVTFDGLTPPIERLPDDQVMVLAKTAADNGWKPGDTIHVWFPVSGRQTWKIAATFNTRVGTGAEYVTNLDTVTANATPDFQVDSTIYVKLRDGITPEAGKRALEPGLKKVAPSAGLNTLSGYLDERLAILDSVVNLIYVLLGLSIVIALVGVGNTISLSIHERTREMGLLRAVGMARRQLGESVGWESGIIALAGTVVGLGLGIVMAIVFVDALDQQGLSPVVNASSMVVIGTLGALAGVVAAIRPAWRATKVDVLAAIASV